MSNEMLGAVGLGVVLLLVVGIFIFHALCLALAAKLVSLPNRTFLKACGCSLLIGVACLVINFLFSLALGPVGVLLSLLIGFFLSAGIISGIYGSGYGAGLGVAIISWVFSIIIGIAVIVLGLGAIFGVGAAVQQQGAAIQSKFNEASRQIAAGSGSQDAKAELSRQMLYALKGKLAVYQVSNNQFPASLQDVDSQYLNDGFGNPIQYRLTYGGRGFELLSYGADGKPGGTGAAADISVTGP